jgi:hypothetical protein
MRTEVTLLLVDGMFRSFTGRVFQPIALLESKSQTLVSGDSLVGG